MQVSCLQYFTYFSVNIKRPHQKRVMQNIKRSSMPISDHISVILYVTGAITSLVVVQYFFPAKVLKLLNQIEIHDEAGLLFARHWGLLAFSLGALLIYAADHPQARAAIMLFALIEKAGLVALIAIHSKRSYTRGLRLTALFDSICCVLYASYLTGIA
jgi:hypothetical protein